MRVSKRGVGLAIVTLTMVAVATMAYAQATSTFNGRVLDQGDAVLPGVTITATNNATGVMRTTVTNSDGSYYLPGLEIRLDDRNRNTTQPVVAPEFDNHDLRMFRERVVETTKRPRRGIA